MQNWDYQCVQGWGKCVNGSEKYAKSVYNMMKSVSKVCKSYFVHTLGVPLIKVITKCKTENISVNKVEKSVYRVLKSTPQVCTRF